MIIITLIILCVIIAGIYLFIIKTVINVLDQKRLVKEFVLKNYDEIMGIKKFNSLTLRQIVDYFSSFINDLVNKIRNRQLCPQGVTDFEIKKWFPKISKSLIRKIDNSEEIKIIKKFTEFCTKRISENVKKYI